MLIGVSGSGKTSVGRRLAPSLGATFLDADDYHPPGNIAKMRAGIPLGDADRWPWLIKLGRVVARHACGGRSVVLACSALRRVYRETLVGSARHPLIFVHLAADEAVIARRMQARQHHFMPASLLRSQLAAIEPLQGDETGFAVAETGTVEQTVATIRRRLRLGHRARLEPDPPSAITPHGRRAAVRGRLSFGKGNRKV